MAGYPAHQELRGRFGLAVAAWTGRDSGTQDPGRAGAFREEPVLSLNRDDITLKKVESAY